VLTRVYIILFFFFLFAKHIEAQEKDTAQNFANNLLNWEQSNDENSESYVSSGSYFIRSKTNAGSSRVIQSPYNKEICNISCDLNTRLIGSENQTGLIFGFDSWRDYRYFVLDNKYVYIGVVSDNVTTALLVGKYVGNIVKGKNNLQVIYRDTKTLYFLNGTLVFESNIYQNKGNKIGFVVPNKDLLEITHFKISQTSEKIKSNEISEENSSVKSFGCGLLFPREGYVLTCNSNMDLGTEILVEVKEKVYAAKKVFVNDIVDLALLKLYDYVPNGSDNPCLSLLPTKTSDSLFLYSFDNALSNKVLKVDSLKASKFVLSMPLENSIFQFTKRQTNKKPGSLLVNNNNEIVGMLMKNKNNSSYINKISEMLAFIEGSGSDLNPESYFNRAYSDQNAINEFLVLIRTK